MSLQFCGLCHMSFSRNSPYTQYLVPDLGSLGLIPVLSLFRLLMLVGYFLTNRRDSLSRPVRMLGHAKMGAASLLVGKAHMKNALRNMNKSLPNHLLFISNHEEEEHRCQRGHSRPPGQAEGQRGAKSALRRATRRKKRSPKGNQAQNALSEGQLGAKSALRRTKRRKKRSPKGNQA